MGNRENEETQTAPVPNADTKPVDPQTAAPDRAYPKIGAALLLCLFLLALQAVLGGIVGFVAGVIAVMTGGDASLVAQAPFFETLMLLANFIADALVIYIGFRLTKRPFNEVFKFKAVPLRQWGAATVFIIGLVIVCSELDNLVNALLPMPALFQNLFASMAIEDSLGLSILMIGVLPAIFEELLFRGLFIGGFEKRYSRQKTIIVSALLFAAIHLNPWQAVTAFVIGAFAAWIRLNSGSLLLCVYLHLFNNTLYVVIAEFGDRIPIPGFNQVSGQNTGFQPIWFDLIGAALTLAGLFLLARNFKARARSGADTIPAE
jgi:membrane protease YdiL (CAAX protease family)